jgi:hypothetical protein
MNRQRDTTWNALLQRTLTLYLFTTESHKSTVPGCLLPISSSLLSIDGYTMSGTHSRFTK